MTHGTLSPPLPSAARPQHPFAAAGSGEAGLQPKLRARNPRHSAPGGLECDAPYSFDAASAAGDLSGGGLGGGSATEGAGIGIGRPPLGLGWGAQEQLGSSGGDCVGGGSSARGAGSLARGFGGLEGPPLGPPAPLPVGRSRHNNGSGSALPPSLGHLSPDLMGTPFSPALGSALFQGLRPRGFSVDGAGLVGLQPPLQQPQQPQPQQADHEQQQFGGGLASSFLQPFGGGDGAAPPPQRRISAPSAVQQGLDADVAAVLRGRPDQGAGIGFGPRPHSQPQQQQPRQQEQEEQLLAAMSGLLLGPPATPPPQGVPPASEAEWRAAAAAAVAMQAQAAEQRAFADAVAAYAQVQAAAQVQAMQHAMLEQQAAYEAALAVLQQQQQRQQLLGTQASAWAALGAAGAKQAQAGAPGLGAFDFSGPAGSKLLGALGLGGAGSGGGASGAPSSSSSTAGSRRTSRQGDAPGVRDTRRSLDRGIGGGAAAADAQQRSQQQHRQRDEAPDYRRVFIGNIGWWVDEELLRQSFERFGTIIDVQVGGGPSWCVRCARSA
jgi:hypothetical protein